MATLPPRTHTLTTAYPWTQPPLVSGAPMRLIALPPLAIAISAAGGLGFLGAGSDASTLATMLSDSASLAQTHASLRDVPGVLPVGVGLLLWPGETLLREVCGVLKQWGEGGGKMPAALWLFAPREQAELGVWARALREATGGVSRIWVQVGTVADAVSATRVCGPEVLVVQGADAGGHGLQRGAGVVALLPEVADALAEEFGGDAVPELVAAGGVVEGRGAAAAVVLGAGGVCLGTRFLATKEANVARGYVEAVLGARDGGVSTARGKVYDQLRGTTEWPDAYGGRGVLNQSWVDAEGGMGFEENQRRYQEAAERGDDGWGPGGRLTTYAGTGVGLVKGVMGAGEVTEEVREGAKRLLGGKW